MQMGDDGTPISIYWTKNYERRGNGKSICEKPQSSIKTHVDSGKKNKKNNNTHKNEQNINVQRHLIQFSHGFIFSICCHAASMNDSFFRFSLFI